MKNLTAIFFIIPFVFTALNIQSFIGNFISVSLSQNFAYINILLLLGGTVLILSDKERERFPGIILLWYLFYSLYYSIGFIANEIHDFEAPFLKSSIPFIYFMAFSLFFSKSNNRDLFPKILMITFTLANILLIYFDRINFSLDHDGVTIYTLDRAGGVYGDANNAAVVCLLSIAFIYHYFKPKNRLEWAIKAICLIIALYGLFLTFSKTGFLVLLIIGILLLRRYINVQKILFILISVPIVIYLLYQHSFSNGTLSLVQKQRINDIINILTLNTSEVSYSGRDVLLQNMMTYINENPILGNGVYFSTAIRGHNTIFGVWADAGILCFVLFLLILLLYFIKSFAVDSNTKYFSLSVLTILFVFMLTLQTIINQGYLIAIFAFLAYSLEATRKKVSTEPKGLAI